MGLEASNCCYLDYGVKNLTNLIDCSFVLSSFFLEWMFHYFYVQQTQYFWDIFSLAFHGVFQPHSMLHSVTYFYDVRKLHI